jgi:hypothetical protein
MQVFDFALVRPTFAAHCGRRLRPAMLALLVSICGAGFSFAEESASEDKPQVRLIGATTVVTEVTTGVPLPARVDTGATSCSIHCVAMEIKDAHPDPRENIGKPVRFLVKNGEGEGSWVESKIVDHVTVRTAEREDERYKVRLRLRWEDVEKKVVATLNDRQRMKYPMLLGRNFLRDDFLVNVSLDAKE